MSLYKSARSRITMKVPTVAAKKLKSSLIEGDQSVSRVLAPDNRHLGDFYRPDTNSRTREVGEQFLDNIG